MILTIYTPEHIEVTKVLLAYDASLMETDSLEETVLHKASTNGDDECLLLLLNHQGKIRKFSNNL